MTEWVIEWLSEWLIEWLIEYAIFLHGLAQQWETKFDTKVAWGEDDAQTSNTCIVQRKCTIPHLTMKNMNCFVITALCNQAFASDFGDDQSRYLYVLLGSISQIIVAIFDLGLRTKLIAWRVVCVSTGTPFNCKCVDLSFWCHLCL